ncbi:MarR family transcriptional regulator [Amycolatopsis sp. DSM 110486]|uniref:MarR family transcriptional regulator n=1 Tax=Amycolatopsis sp. DSM 110486 TaxID=2865832 RepID=UPI001C6A725E|nr:MarR family transcriptional regulator [Amycolatopsis sp. DSM 110486]QYN20919.1 MarR family transcriptional regulator [Amycolatopsis sp. DSM 110486]
MTTSTRARFLVLHALRVKGLAPDPVLQALTGLPADEVAAEVAALVADGLAVRREGRLAGTMPTPAGRAAHPELLVADVADSTEALSAAYEAFLPVNGEFKRVCSAWQLRPSGEPNDHSDAAYDAGVAESLAEVNANVTGLLDELTASAGRFGTYPVRLAGALRRVRAGETAAFARPMADSYHDIWMELHQDLLLSAGRERSAADEG